MQYLRKSDPLLKNIRSNVPNIDKAVISVHCHNDLGLAVANTIAAIENGARQAEVTVNGIGERAGNAALEELIMTLNVRKDMLPYTTNIKQKHIYNSSRLISNITGLNLARNKPIVGENAFAHESGIHQDGYFKNRETYEIMSPASIGRDKSEIVLGRHSGSMVLKNVLKNWAFSFQKMKYRIYTKNSSILQTGKKKYLMMISLQLLLMNWEWNHQFINLIISM